MPGTAIGAANRILVGAERRIQRAIKGDGDERARHLDRHR